MGDAAIRAPAAGPRSGFGALVRAARKRFFGTPLDAAITLACLAALWFLVPPLVKWALIDMASNGKVGFLLMMKLAQLNTYSLHSSPDLVQ